MKTIICSFVLLLSALSTNAQCKIVLDEIDEFDSLRTIAIEPIQIGAIIPSQFETEDGPTFIPEGKLLVAYSQNDSINSFFLTFVVAEYNYQPIDKGFNVLLLLENEDVDALYNVPDRGEFDKGTNMRIYQHTTVLPLDYFYQLTRFNLDKVRINYKNQRKTITLSDEQKKAVQEAVRCIGEKAGLYPVKP
ncbi:MAG TPA: hypothetical protein PKE06_19400 [Flavilitoribacter sp.]|nr:hypothetical protein [Lewinella sp.]HMQ62856.1 hypothetical protein [Flavilitoribacter sp.]HMQ88410.1 hypothetical protein [Flavilitoribacter sp.]